MKRNACKNVYGPERNVTLLANIESFFGQKRSTS